jgi:hypothetical protein
MRKPPNDVHPSNLGADLGAEDQPDYAWMVSENWGVAYCVSPKLSEEETEGQWTAVGAANSTAALLVG